MNHEPWYTIEEGATIGQPGSEEGITLLDEEHSYGMRITLEENAPSAPFAITCGIYGNMVHTRFFADREIARSEYEAMKIALVNMIQVYFEIQDAETANKEFNARQDQFFARFP